MREFSAVWVFSDVRMFVPSIFLYRTSLVFFAAKWAGAQSNNYSVSNPDIL
jgi:hypothetical protein